MYGYKTIIWQAIPIILARVALTLGMVINNWIVSALGTDVIAATALSTTIYMGFFTFASGNLYGISTTTAREYANKNYAGIMHVLSNGLYYATILGIILVGIFYNIPWLLKLFHEPPRIITLLERYYTYFAPSVLPMLWTVTIQEVIIGCNRQAIVFKYGIFRMILGILLTYVFVFGKFGCPAMGFPGLGLSSLIASLLSCILLVLYLCWREYAVIKHYFKLKVCIPTYQFIKMIQFGLPIGIQISGEILAIMFAALLIGRFGVIALAAEQIVFQYLLLFAMVSFGLSQAVAIIVSTLYTKKQYELVYTVVCKSMVIIVAFLLVIAIVYVVMPYNLIYPYIYKHKLQSQDIIHLATRFFYIIAIYQVFDGIRMVVGGILRGFGYSSITMIIGVCCFWLIGIPMAVYLMIFTTFDPTIVPLSLMTAVILSTIILAMYSVIKIKDKLLI